MPANPFQGLEDLRHASNMCGWTNCNVLVDLSAEEIVKLCRACWSSKWDICPDQLTLEERQHAAKTGELSAAACARLEKELG